MQDYYETLQVHPKADAEAIRAAYERLRQRYEPALLEGAADELVELARRRRDEIERAFTVLSDPRRRAAFDGELQTAGPAAPAPPATASGPAVGATDDDLIDYRPLPPARRQERPKGFVAQPYLPPSQAPRRSGRSAQPDSRLPVWIAPVLIVAVATFAIVLVTLITTVTNATVPTTPAAGGPNILGQPSSAAAAPTPSIDDIANQFEGQIVAARQVAAQVPDNANAWIELGNALYDSVVVVRERLNSGDQRIQSIYVERLPRWLEARDAYSKALAISPDNAMVRADLSATLCYYGSGVNDQSFVAQGLAEADQALTQAPEEARALLSKGLCLISADPPQVPQALEQWQKAIVMPGVAPGIAAQARQLIAEYSR